MQMDAISQNNNKMQTYESVADRFAVPLGHYLNIFGDLGWAHRVY